ncbi:hypothetical protein [Pelagibacterium sediminicola]|uniref:hypothetical protein n=1 Tax=Pelagibacterium sediminicola TaxID=2248761 RepID=UPI000E31DFE3|nr:hypothetical protein [Pelagibacterium sediminicola]
MNKTTAIPPSRLLLLVVGFIVWSVAFIALYALNAIGCGFGWDAGFQRALLIGLFALHTVVLGGFAVGIVRHLRGAGFEPARTLAWAGLGLTVAALASTVLVFAPSLFASMCV